MTEEIIAKLKKIGVGVPKILLTKDGINLNKWAVVACDQFTSEPEYWHEVEKYVGESPSTLKITLPEIYLESEDKSERIAKTVTEMKKYLDEETLEEKFEGFVLVDRKTKNAESRKGLVVALDLEKYEYMKGSKTLIRATEGTVESRIPPRLEIRKNALIELPHIMVLIDDPNKTVIEPLFEENLKKIYDIKLMMEGGQIRGWQISEEKLIEKIGDALEKLISEDGFLFAMGDGNHSLATAKTHWNNIKNTLSESEKGTHPARFALVELVNVHDDGLEFEPIHRVLFGVDKEKLVNYLRGEGKEIEMIVGGVKEKIKIKEMGSNLPVGDLQKLLEIGRAHV